MRKCVRYLECYTCHVHVYHRFNIICMMALSIFCSFSLGWLIGGPMIWVVALTLIYGFSAIAESPVYSSGLSEVVSPRYLCTAFGFRSLVGFSAGALVPTVFGAIMDWTNPLPAGGPGNFPPIWGWAFSMLGAVALLGPWAMFKLRSLPESLQMAGGKK